MRLSEAIMLGSATCSPKAFDINSCAVGGALNAVGIPQIDWEGPEGERYEAVRAIWPWLNHGWEVVWGETEDGVEHEGQDWGSTIFALFDNAVCLGTITLEQLADYVRSIEPDCDCNRFNCYCAEVERAWKVIEMRQFAKAG